jgi:hypothetical protein
MFPSDKTAQLWADIAPLVRLAMHMPELQIVARAGVIHEQMTAKQASIKGRSQ